MSPRCAPAWTSSKPNCRNWSNRVNDGKPHSSRATGIVMAFIRVSSPHAHSTNTTAGVMRQILLATLPGLAALTAYFGSGTLINVLLACAAAVVFEAAVLKMRQRPVMFYLRDCSALVTAVLLGLALPPYCPWWVVVVGMFFAIVVAKQLYG